MKDEDSSLPLDGPGGDAPPELVRALRALANERPSRAHLERVADRLEALVDASPPLTTTASTTVLARGVAGKWLALRLVIAAFAVGSAAVWLRGSLVTEPNVLPRQLTEPTAVAARVPTPAAVEAGSAREQDEAKRTREGTRRTSIAAAPTTLRHEAGADVSRGGASSPGTAREPRALRRVVSRGLAPTVQAPPGPTPTSTPDTADPESPISEPRARPPVVELPPAPPPMKSEVELLLTARQTLKSNPKAALRALAEHGERFADGVLAHEREVLAIEALRLVGETEAAAQRLRAFQARYPKSMHRWRLQRTVR